MRIILKCSAKNLLIKVIGKIEHPKVKNKLKYKNLLKKKNLFKVTIKMKYKCSLKTEMRVLKYKILMSILI